MLVMKAEGQCSIAFDKEGKGILHHSTPQSDQGLERNDVYDVHVACFPET